MYYLKACVCMLREHASIMAHKNMQTTNLKQCNMPTFFSAVRPISVKTVIFSYCTVKSSFLYVLFSLLEEGFDIDRLVAAVSEINSS
jgi:hypothetical protein